jgi:hypothetical protein
MENTGTMFRPPPLERCSTRGATPVVTQHTEPLNHSQRRRIKTNHRHVNEKCKERAEPEGGCNRMADTLGMPRKTRLQSRVATALAAPWQNFGAVRSGAAVSVAAL